MSKFVSAVVWICLLFMTAGNAPASGIPETDTTRTLSPYFFIEDAASGVDQLPLKHTAVTATITGVIADVKVVQQYANTGKTPIHARYVFPASTRAAVHGMRMQVGEQVIAAKIQEREVAKKTFECAKAEGKSASLLTQERPNVFSMRVANIMPGDTIKVELHYTELLVPTEGIYEFVFPTVVGPRYGTVPEAGAPDHHQWLKNPYLKAGEPPTSQFEMTTRLTSPFAIQDLNCPSHDTDITWQSATDASVSLSASETRGHNRDVILQYRLADARIQTGLMLYEGAEENVFLMMMQPPARIAPELIPPREYVFVVDVSGSMHGFPLTTVKVLLERLIGGLRSADRFNVVLFEAGSKVLFPQSVPASSENIAHAKALIDGEAGGGGTELKKALEKALGLARAEGVSRSVIVVTDGYIGIETDVFAMICENLQQTNVFAFGIGGSVNRYLIEGIAHAGQGEPFVVTDQSEAAATAARFKAYIEAPVLTHIRVQYEGVDVYDLEPAGFGDLFADRPLIVCGKWRGNPRGKILVSGVTGAGPFSAQIDMTASPDMSETSALPFLWARKRLSRLSDFGAESEDVHKEEITALGLAYHLLTRFTAFVAVDETVRNPDGAKDVDQPLPLPLNVSNLAVGGAHSVPEPSLWVMGLLLLFGLLGAGPGRRHIAKRDRSKNAKKEPLV